MNDILLIGLNYYKYDAIIANEMKKFGYNVDVITDRPKKYNKIKKHFTDKKLQKIVNWHQKKILKLAKKKEYKKVIVIVGHQLTEGLFFELKKLQPKAQYILYLWDAVKYVPNFTKIKKYYDYIYSFDLKDCKKYGLRHLPLFYCESYVNEEKIIKYDLYSSMVEHTDRIQIVKEILERNHTKSIKVIIKTDKVNWIKQRFITIMNPKKDKRLSYIGFQMSANKISKLMNRSKAILDIQIEGQDGLTMRTIEALGCRKKIVTTNSDIINYDFYCANNIYVLERTNPHIDWSFFELEYQHLDEEIYVKYSIYSWVETLLNTKENNYLRDGE